MADRIQLTGSVNAEGEAESFNPDAKQKTLQTAEQFAAQSADGTGAQIRDNSVGHGRVQMGSLAVQQQRLEDTQASIQQFLGQLDVLEEALNTGRSFPQSVIERLGGDFRTIAIQWDAAGQNIHSPELVALRERVQAAQRLAVQNNRTIGK